MGLRTYENLRELYKKFKPRVFGKIAQKLLALGFQKSGATHIVEREVQGVDIDVVLEGARYAVEVKTTSGPNAKVQFDGNNIKALCDRAADGYTPSVAVLSIAPCEDWILATPPLEELHPGSCLIDRFRAYRLPSLEAMVQPAFEGVVLEEFQATMEQGPEHLDKKLRGHGGEVRSHAG